VPNAYISKFSTGLLTALVIAFLVGTAAAQTDSTARGAWQIKCRDNGCVAKQVLANPNKPGILYSSEIAMVDDGQRIAMTLSFPLGIYLPRGIGVKVGDETRDIPMTVCLPAGCQALVVVDDALSAALSAEDSFAVRFYTTSEKPAEVVFSLNGFDAAIESLTKLP
jgi:invasion protein IalB